MLPAAKPAAVTCGDAGVILRGSVDDVKKAAPAKEARIASACLHDRWPATVLACIGSEQAPTDCLEQLTDVQRASFHKELVAWADLHGEAIDDDLDVSIDHAPADCTAAIDDVAVYAPVLTVTGEERAFAIELRQEAIEAACNASWSNEVKRCFESSDVETCRKQLASHDQQALVSKLAYIDAVLGKIGATKQQPATTYDCKKVAAAHYSDAAWQGKAEVPKDPKATRAALTRAAADRKKLIADSRAAMQTACTGEAWSATARACIVGGVGDACFRGMGQLPASWGFPPVGVLQRTGIAECDSYSTTNAALLACKQFPQDARDAVRQGFEGQRQIWLNARADQKASYASACKQAEEAIRQAAQAMGCAI